ncbi:hypothetical protein [Acinetobacter ursingii]|uniref:Glycosyltransferase n=2 Tax=Acinetobacter ursingii TaxID=108980 RepID=A0A3D2SJ34_9GAMM|nr:hypothetical protein [Acinetobacter ursingii]MCH2005644.1 hypothetical protein [Acinetobacter ursingii]MCU4305552.1 hypothetical protein [Acinetobacter ursingii]MCU4371709.1 hypothetical protein [Acinetobacter ursingii]MCU4382040.1 hypothetical protein [Acinetobacter ursingii]MCU4608534.1 hypothetical protein [Acinetobacter ursingii]
MSFRKEYYKIFRNLYRKFFTYVATYKVYPKSKENVDTMNILIVGIYLTDYANQADLISSHFGQSNFHNIKQVWYAIGENEVPDNMRNITIGHSREKIPKFKLLNNILKEIDIQQYDLIIFSDDDIFIRKNFIDVYTHYINEYKFKLAQPARTKHSYYDHKICLQFDNKTLARSTNFVEIGPVFSITQDVFDKFLPFPEESPMGYGLDYVWPIISRENQFRIGIIDATPVDHSYRAQGKTYVSNHHVDQMQTYLEHRKNTKNEEKVVYEYFK